MAKGRCARDAPPQTINIGTFKFVEKSSTTIKHIYNESANIIEGCNVAFDTNGCCNFPYWYYQLYVNHCDPGDYELVKYNLKIYNWYLNQCIRNAKKNYYTREFTKYKGDIRKTWDTLKDILNKTKGESTFPAYFLSENEHVFGSQNIANKFNEYFTNIGPDLARSINTANKAPFDSYLKTPCSNSFLFQYTNPTDIAKTTCQLKHKQVQGMMIYHQSYWKKLLAAFLAH